MNYLLFHTFFYVFFNGYAAFPWIDVPHIGQKPLMTFRLLNFLFAFLDNKLMNIPIAKYACPCLFSQEKKILVVKLVKKEWKFLLFKMFVLSLNCSPEKLFYILIRHHLCYDHQIFTKNYSLFSCLDCFIFYHKLFGISSLTKS